MSIAVSVIVPVYNAEKYIERCLDSVLSQTFQNFEVIATDDGSTDRSPDLLKKYSDRITILTQANRGASSARNRGIHAARGKYIAFIDSDDCWHVDKLRIQSRLMEDNPEVVACYTRATRSLDRLASSTFTDEPVAFLKKTLNDVFRSPYLGTSSFMVKRNVINQLNGFDETLKTAEDIDLFLRVSVLGLIAQIDEALVFKARIDDSLGGQLSSYRDNLYVVNRFLDNSDQGSELAKLSRQVKAKIYYDWARDLAWHGNTAQSMLRSAQYFVHSRTFRNLEVILRFVGGSVFRNKDS